MSLADLDVAIELIRSSTLEWREWGGQDDEAISAAEAELGVRFPPTYRRFVAESVRSMWATTSSAD